MEDKVFWIKYLEKRAVSINTHFVGDDERKMPLKTIDNLISAYQNRPGSSLANVSPEDLFLLLPAGTTRKDSAYLGPDAFAIEEDENDTCLRSDLSLASLGSIGSQFTSPLIIKVTDQKSGVFSGATPSVRKRFDLESLLLFLKDKFGITQGSLTNNIRSSFPVQPRSSNAFNRTIDREYLFRQIIKDLTLCMKGRSHLGSIREQNPLLIVGGGPGIQLWQNKDLGIPHDVCMYVGSGTTHVLDVLLDELLKTIESISDLDDLSEELDLVKSRLENCVYVSISFNNEMPLDELEKDPLSIRVLFR